MNITVLGTGIVGQIIAAKLAGLGHAVTIGTRDVEKTLAKNTKDGMGNPPFSEWYNQNKNKSKIKLAAYADAAPSAELLFNCTSGQASVDAIKALGNTSKGKILIDVANPLDFSKGFPPSLSVVNTDSLGEVIQRTFPDIKVVKTLNTMTCFIMVNPAIVPGDHDVFVSGNDEGAKTKAKEILQSFGWTNSNIIDLGDITTARGTEQLLPIWVRLMKSMNTPMFNFKIVKA
jgi:8-hydroxy-5-deazaflavin:NADPH oxidoreductase